MTCRAHLVRCSSRPYDAEAEAAKAKAAADEAIAKAKQEAEEIMAAAKAEQEAAAKAKAEAEAAKEALEQAKKEAEDVAASQPRVIMVGGAKSGGEAAPPGTAELSQAAVEAPSDGEAASASVVGGWNIHTFVNFDEFSMKSSPN